MSLSRRKFILNSLLAVGASIVTKENTIMAAQGNESPFPAHAPLGQGKGINPGRVVWTRDPKAVSWDGVDFWWRPGNFDLERIIALIGNGLALLTGEKNPAASWKALFGWHNRLRGEEGFYRTGQKLAIKTNMNGVGEYNDDPGGRVSSSYGNPVVLQALLLSLVKDGGVDPEDITVYDAGRIFPDYMREMCTQGMLAGVKFRYRDAGGANEAKADKKALIKWAGPIKGVSTYLPQCVTEADYLINLANLKGHSWGMTLAAKNHFGSFINEDASRSPQAAGLHENIIGAEMGTYSALTDLLAHKDLGGKTILWILDALITAPSETGAITLEKAQWDLPPFAGGFAASLFMSQDPVALDSVGADFLVNEPVMRHYNSGLKSNRGMENYLHEAALLENPPSGSNYTNGAGVNPGSLGVHEHWNNPIDKKYSRNVGKGEGIELIQG